MIEIRINGDKFESDVRAMVQAFYPNEKLYVVKERTELEVQKRPDGPLIRTLSFNTDSYDDKNVLKKDIYGKLSADMGKSLSWGILTGVRPTKIPMNFLDAGRVKEDIIDALKRIYLLNDDKANLITDVAARERTLIGTITDDTYSLYVNIPFCPTRCLYCSFDSYPIGAYEDAIPSYVDALKKELKAIEEINHDKKLLTIYFGGGTPTSLSAKHLREIMSFINETFDLRYLREWTVEAGRPDSIDIEKLKAIKECGGTRVSINPQTMNDKTLKVIGRAHTADDVRNAFHLAKESGIDVINMDMILGLPGESTEDVRFTLDRIVEFKPENLTVHSLAMKSKAPLVLEKDKYVDFSMENPDENMMLAREYAGRLELLPYYLYRQRNMVGNGENIGFAKEGTEGLYNILIMEELHSIYSAGAGAITKIVKTKGTLNKRIENVKDVKEYISRIDEMIKRKVDI